MASVVESCVGNFNSLIELAWDDPEVVQCLYKPAKISLLHQYIYAMISVEERRDYRKNADLYEDDETIIDEFEELFHTYEIPIESCKAFKLRRGYKDLDDEWPFRDWFEAQEEHFEQLWEKITDEVFHLLFSNRTFLLKFNEALASYLQAGNVSVPKEFLDEKGKIKRATPFPSWIKKAVYCRDHGRCVFCQKDLSGLLSTDRVLHYDHMVPLKLWGTNDPCNMQLLCEECNLKKSGGKARTEYLYPPWWDY